VASNVSRHLRSSAHISSFAPLFSSCLYSSIAPPHEAISPSPQHCPFFDIPRAASGSIKLTALAGTIQLSGDEHFSVE
jgi:hypothetical protein